MKKDNKGQNSAEMLAQVEGLQLRAVMACLSRCSERILPRIDTHSYDLRLCGDIVDMAWSFAAGEGASALEIWRFANEWTRVPRASADDQVLRNAVGAIRHTAFATRHAYEAVTISPFSTEKLGLAQDDAAKAIRQGLCAGGVKARQAFQNDYDHLLNTHAGEFSSLGLPVRSGPMAMLGKPPKPVLGPLWWDIEPPQWSSKEELDVVRLGPKLLPVEGYLNFDRVNQKKPTFICLFVGAAPAGIDDSMLRPAIEALEGAESLQPRPGIVIYVPNIDRATRLELTLLGGLVVTPETLEGCAPKNLDEFVEVYRSKLYHWAHPRLRANWRRPRNEVAAAGLSITEARARQPATEEPVRDDAFYQNLLAHLSMAPPFEH